MEGEYTIYRAGRVMVHFHDPAIASAQRKALSTLSAPRAELNSLLSGLPNREPFDAQLAYALQLVLDGDPDGSRVALAAAKADVLVKHALLGQVQYLKWSYGVAAVMLGLLFLAGWAYRFDEPSSNIWLAGKAGLIGAAFSIALAIRRKALPVAIDDPATNVMDGALRLLIWVVSAGVLLLLLASGAAPPIKIGDANFSGNNLTWQIVLLMGFVAGFLERLVPDLLDKKRDEHRSSLRPVTPPIRRQRRGS